MLLSCVVVCDGRGCNSTKKNLAGQLLDVPGADVWQEQLVIIMRNAHRAVSRVGVNALGMAEFVVLQGCNWRTIALYDCGHVRMLQ